MRSETATEQYARTTQWHPWYAWHPVRIGKYKVWLAWVLRKAREASFDGYGGFIWEYKDAEDSGLNFLPGAERLKNTIQRLTHGRD